MDNIDLINHPNHYNWHPQCEAKDITGAFNYNHGTAIAYIWRCEHKGTKKDDLEKAIKHLKFELERVEKSNERGK